MKRVRIKFEIPAVIEQENNFQKKKFILSVLGSKIDLITIVLIIFILKIVYYTLFLRFLMKFNALSTVHDIASFC